jgi:carbamoylphosphate synthase small subunit
MWQTAPPRMPIPTPEASPGPHDSHYLFRDFRKMMEEWKK